MCGYSGCCTIAVSDSHNNNIGVDDNVRKGIIHYGNAVRIQTAVGQLDLPLVWAEIAVAALAGSAFYGGVALIERAVTFWHPSLRGRA